MLQRRNRRFTAQRRAGLALRHINHHSPSSISSFSRTFFFTEGGGDEDAERGLLLTGAPVDDDKADDWREGAECADLNDRIRCRGEDDWCE